MSLTDISVVLEGIITVKVLYIVEILTEMEKTVYL